MYYCADKDMRGGYLVQIKLDDINWEIFNEI